MSHHFYRFSLHMIGNRNICLYLRFQFFFPRFAIPTFAMFFFVVNSKHKPMSHATQFFEETFCVAKIVGNVNIIYTLYNLLASIGKCYHYTLG